MRIFRISNNYRNPLQYLGFKPVSPVFDAVQRAAVARPAIAASVLERLAQALQA